MNHASDLAICIEVLPDGTFFIKGSAYLLSGTAQCAIGCGDRSASHTWFQYCSIGRTVELFSNSALFVEHTGSDSLCLLASSGLTSVSETYCHMSFVFCFDAHRLVDTLVYATCQLILLHGAVCTLLHSLCTVVTVHNGNRISRCRCLMLSELRGVEIRNYQQFRIAQSI